MLERFDFHLFSPGNLPMSFPLSLKRNEVSMARSI